MEGRDVQMYHYVRQGYTNAWRLKFCMVAPNICWVLSVRLAIHHASGCYSFEVVPRLLKKFVHPWLTVRCAIFLVFSPEI
jgi:hypothetical protein